MKNLLAVLVVGLTFLTVVGADEVQLRKLDDQSKVEIHVAGTHFTSYCYGDDFKTKPVFYPVLTPEGSMVNRGYPMLEDIEGESYDHPHHQSLSFTYGDVNGLDFWSNHSPVKIVHREFLKLESGSRGVLQARLDWITNAGKVILKENKTVTFGAMVGARWMDHDMTLTAADEPVTFGDTKEGMFAIRVAHSLRERGGTGRYINAYGWETAKGVWGKRAPWVALAGRVADENVTVAIFDHPSTENHPSYWHARDYGLFAANPLGRKDYIGIDEPTTRTLEPGQSYHFRHRVVIYEGKVSKQRLDDDYWEYVK